MKPSRDSHTGVYLLPNLFTTASLFAAFYSLVASLKGQYEPAIVAIFIGMVADGLDGRIARLTNTQSAFGAQYDSLSDMVTFGVAPPILMYSAFLNQLGKLGWLVAFLYTAAVALRLARFNTQLETADKRYFQGLACPPAAAVTASLVWVCQENNFQGFGVTVFVAVIAVLIALLMVSNVRYYSFKDVDFRGRVPFLHVLVMVILFIAIASHPALVLLSGFGLYAMSGPIQTLVAIQRVRRAARSRNRRGNKL
ncbi:CDP-diacylglycerol-serine O-phosphatidyltransferase (phosphatidylserine synthase) [Legionella geestiana]|uniref:CDP-diacylglycerol--serine O-phosphatidyltransferase n=1 Tax=Legionella geestiana TaxID=45065 RepID=A0A0W0U7W8_9GAMM|nr:CDP-diacylglycerol--serine O-phosphatidyltransferase [Legionella geestiana]KTD03766.1 CDP-diacylglycerol-serine O-phosphatidyltransferase (phosphatidylserine synthase) [Legionella geestiana]QBS11948.1 CDP-diacylglycerol--serine O-phosphatidyltransferase [Legionella geestiana]STX53339.1 CDP-diacylglycerol-serine O-phosphatidyltransferase (phosphatidylserine synthase) [Legionella geestiana]